MEKKWTRFLASVLIVPFTMIGCADKEAMQQYYAVETQRTNAIIDSIEIQQRNHSDSRTLQMQTFSSAATNAAATESPVDDALLAFAWGYQMGQPMKIEIPKLQPIKAPDSSADLVRAWTPIIGMAMPFLYPLAYGWGSGSGGTRVTADNGGTVLMDSANSGSYNRASGDMTSTLTNSGQQGANYQENCASGECEEGDGNEVEGETLPIEDCVGDGGYQNPVTGKWYTDGTQTCSCGSNAAGEC